MRLLFTFLLLASSTLFAQMPDWEKIQIKAVKVAGNIYMLDAEGGFGGGNVGVSVGEDGIILVDDKFRPLTAKIEAALKGISDQPVRFILNTHVHGDHTDGNLSWGKRADIIAHTNVRKRLATEPEKQFGDKPMPKEGLPVITFDDSLTIHMNGEEVQAIHFPGGHTDGDAVIFFTGSKVVHMGDLYFNGMFPYIDSDSGGNARDYSKNLYTILKRIPEDVKVIPGHGPIASKADLQKDADMLADAIRIMEAAIKAGKSLEDVKKEKILAKYDSYSWDFISTDAMVEQLYKQLK